MPKGIIRFVISNRWILISFSAILTAFSLLMFHREREQEIVFQDDLAKSDAIQAVLDSSNHGFSIVDEYGNLIEWSPFLERLTGWSKDELKSIGLMQIIPDEMEQKHRTAFLDAFKRQKENFKTSVVYCKMPHRDKNIDPIEVRVSVRLVETRYGKRYAIALIDLVENIKLKEGVSDVQD
jgi:PAS domain S-box-containing protein